MINIFIQVCKENYSLQLFFCFKNDLTWYTIKIFISLNLTNIYIFFFSTGEIDEAEHEILVDSVLKSLQKVSSHPKPLTLTPDFFKLLMHQDGHQETFGRVINSLPLSTKVEFLNNVVNGKRNEKKNFILIFFV